MAFYGGVPQVMVSDHLKAAVNRITQLGSQVHRFFKALAHLYRGVVHPTRPLPSSR